MSTTGEVTAFPVEKEYGKHPHISQDDISKLRLWLHTQPHLPGDHITDLDLIITYHCCERSPEVTKQVLDLHFTLRTLFNAFFKERTLDTMTEHCLNTILYAPLPKPTVKGYRAVYVRLLDFEPKNFYFSEGVRTFMMMFDLWQQEEGTWPGLVIMIDMDKSVIGHLTRVDVMTVRQVLYFLQEAMLVKLKEVHFLNAPHFMDKVMMLLRPFMKKALMDILRVHQTNSDTLSAFVDKESLPKESGGQYKTYKEIRDDLIKRMHNNKQFLKEENKKRVQESLRPGGKRTTVESLFGIEGSFKKLDID